MTPGLANKLCRKHAKKICCNFPETVELFDKGKGVLTGSPIRRELITGDRATGLKLCGFNTEKPILMVIGGSLGALHVNEAIRENRVHKTYLCAVHGRLEGAKTVGHDLLLLGAEDDFDLVAVCCFGDHVGVQIVVAGVGDGVEIIGVHVEEPTVAHGKRGDDGVGQDGRGHHGYRQEDGYAAMAKFLF